jgi:hypothetical protein
MQWKGTTVYLTAFENNAANPALDPTILGAPSIEMDTTLLLSVSH